MYRLPGPSCCAGESAAPVGGARGQPFRQSNPPHPVYWLAGDGTRLWYRGHERASRRLQRGQFAAAASEAERLIALDGGACAESHGLLAKAWWGLGRRELARAAFRAQVDAASWDRRFRRASGVSSTVLAAIRAECRHHGVATVDLPEVFDQYCGSALPGRRMFLDHCHLTLEGMTVAMAAVATAVARALPRKGKSVPDWQDLARELPPPDVPAAVAGLAQLQAGLYNGNLNYHNWELIEDSSRPRWRPARLSATRCRTTFSLAPRRAALG